MQHALPQEPKSGLSQSGTSEGEAPHTLEELCLPGSEAEGGAAAEDAMGRPQPCNRVGSLEVSLSERKCSVL